jgi:WD40 repeat protein
VRSSSLWDVASGKPIGAPFTAHTDHVKSVAFSPDGKTLASAGWESSIILWDVNLVDWQALACRKANRNLTLDEWQRYLGEDEPYRITCPSLPVEQDALQSWHQQAQDYLNGGDSSRAARIYTQAVQSVAASTDAFPNNNVCWWGSLDGFAQIVMPACERAVALAPDNPQVRDSRGLARALLGNYPEAIEDFKAFVEWSKGIEGAYEKYGIKRESWIQALEAGQNPFDAHTLEELQNE